MKSYFLNFCYRRTLRMLEATSQCWSDGNEVAVPPEIQLIVQRVRARTAKAEPGRS